MTGTTFPFSEIIETTGTRVLTNMILSIMRTLKRVNPADTYYEAYLGHAQRQGDSFFDHYHLAWLWAAAHSPKTILEIGTRTGLSLCQLLSALPEREGVEVVSFDLFNDGFISPKLVEMNLKALNITIPVNFVKGDSAQTVPEYFKANPGKLFDWMLIDGNHDKTAARIDLENTYEHVAPGGILLFDDISTEPGECGLRDVWEQFKSDHPSLFQYGEDYHGKGLGWAIRQ